MRSRTVLVAVLAVLAALVPGLTPASADTTATSTLSGTVYEVTGGPLTSSICVSLYRRGEPWNTMVTAAANGTWSASGVPDGVVDIFAAGCAAGDEHLRTSYPGTLSYGAPIVVTGGVDQSGLDLPLWRYPKTVSGRATADGKPLAGQCVLMAGGGVGAQFGVENFLGVTHDDGRWTAPEHLVWPGRWTIEVGGCDGVHATTYLGDTTRADQATFFTAGSGAVITDLDTHVQAVGVPLTVHLVDSDLHPVDGRCAIALLGNRGAPVVGLPGGTGSFGGFGPGLSVSVQVRPCDDPSVDSTGNTVSGTATMPLDGSAGTLTLVDNRNSRVQGRVTDSGGAPIAGVTVTQRCHSDGLSFPTPTGTVVIVPPSDHDVSGVSAADGTWVIHEAQVEQPCQLLFIGAGIAPGQTYTGTARVNQLPPYLLLDHVDATLRRADAPTVAVPLGAPRGLKAKVAGGRVRLSWARPTGTVTQWQVLNQASHVVANAPGSALSVTVKGLRPGVRYVLRVRAVRGQAKGPASTAVRVRVPR